VPPMKKPRPYLVLIICKS